jgi:hypothetical protein
MLADGGNVRHGKYSQTISQILYRRDTPAALGSKQRSAAAAIIVESVVSSTYVPATLTGRVQFLILHFA